MKFLQVALLFTFVMLVAHVQANHEPPTKVGDPCANDEECMALPTRTLCQAGPNRVYVCTEFN